MKQLTTIEYDVKQLCSEILKITPQTFRNNKQKYLATLEQDYHVEIKIGPRKKEFFILEPKHSQMIVLKDVATDTTILKKNELQNIELILKAVLIDKVIPIHLEIVGNTGLSLSTVKRCIKKMWSAGILIEPEIEEVREVNEYTGEIYDYKIKKHSYIYYDKLPSGKREVLHYPNIHNAFSELFRNKLNKLRFEHKSNFNRDIALSVAGFHAWKELNLSFELHEGNRAEKWIVSPEYRNFIIEKYGRH